MTGQAPFQELQSNKVTELYNANEFPDVTRILCGEIIEKCWHYDIASAQQIYNSIKMVEIKLICEINIHRNSIEANKCMNKNLTLIVDWESGGHICES